MPTFHLRIGILIEITVCRGLLAGTGWTTTCLSTGPFLAGPIRFRLQSQIDGFELLRLPVLPSPRWFTCIHCFRSLEMFPCGLQMETR
ncbi:hypothetical protein M758_UG120900 [Ceratodon purpureus]|nr:hypothetical protein M758_UG120900 [Ceratodon purpureus]